MRRQLDQFDIEAEREGSAIRRHRRLRPRIQRPYYGRNDYKKVSWRYRQAIADAEIIWIELIKSLQNKYNDTVL